MSVVSPERVEDRALLEGALRRNAALHLYEIGDLDDAFFPLTSYFVERDASRNVEAVALRYDGGDPPTLVALAGDDREHAALSRLVPDLLRAEARPVYAHFTPPLRSTIESVATIDGRGHHAKFVWTDRARAEEVGTDDVIQLGPSHADEMLALLDAHYPEHFFHPRVLDDGLAFGIREGGRLVACAGVHVLSRRYRVAALGNVVTSTTHRGRGLALATCAALLRALAPIADVVGLNVDRDNRAALRCYERLGFSFVAEYDEAVLHPTAAGPSGNN
ncbi:MAG: GNAT family N-acetyltransferase [Polyangiaceae bacterium]|nr:GNAT family N-acetyltransferase [Polyangiaceae bacterium]